MQMALGTPYRTRVLNVQKRILTWRNVVALEVRFTNPPHIVLAGQI